MTLYSTAEMGERMKGSFAGVRPKGHSHPERPFQQPKESKEPEMHLQHEGWKEWEKFSIKVFLIKYQFVLHSECIWLSLLVSIIIID